MDDKTNNLPVLTPVNTFFLITIEQQRSGVQPGTGPRGVRFKIHLIIQPKTKYAIMAFVSLSPPMFSRLSRSRNSPTLSCSNSRWGMSMSRKKSSSLIRGRWHSSIVKSSTISTVGTWYGTVYGTIPDQHTHQ